MSVWLKFLSVLILVGVNAFFVASEFTGTPGRYVKLEDTIRSFKGLVEGKYDDLPEQAFYMVGSIEEAIAQAEKMTK